MENENGTPMQASGRKPGRTRNWLIAGAVALAGVAAIGGIGAVQANGGPGHFMGKGGGFGFGGPFAERSIDRALRAADATAEQEDKIWEIVDDARSDLRVVLRDARDTRERLTGLLSAETIDRAAVQSLRAERIVTLDSASHRATEAFLDAVEVLNPEQRAKLLERFRQRGPHR